MNLLPLKIEGGLCCFLASYPRILHVQLALPPPSVRLEVGSILPGFLTLALNTFLILNMERHGCLAPRDAEAASPFVKLVVPYKPPRLMAQYASGLDLISVGSKLLDRVVHRPLARPNGFFSSWTRPGE